MTFNTYRISAPHTDKVYFGVTEKPLANRMRVHLVALRNDHHANEEFQAEYDAQPQGWSIALESAHATKRQALDEETRLVALNANIAMNDYKNPNKVFEYVPRITSAVAAEILALKGEEREYVVAKQFGVSQASVSNIWRGNHWSSCNRTDDLKHVLAEMTAKFLASMTGQSNLVSAPCSI